jgi:hypothetical protein
MDHNGETTNKFYIDNIRVNQMVTPEWIVDGSIEAKHFKSLYGLNVNNRFIVEQNGNITFAGNLNGATGTFSDEISAPTLYVLNLIIYMKTLVTVG